MLAELISWNIYLCMWWHETKCVAQIQCNFCRHFHVVHAPGLNPTWWYLKDRILSNPSPRTLDQLKDNIRREIRNIAQETFPRVMENMAVRMQNVTGQRGAYVENVVWSSKG